jgi:hypothetical protein
MSDLFELVMQPGIQRDGTRFDGKGCIDGQWVRWQDGRPRKMGGYRSIADKVGGPARCVHLDGRNGFNTAHVFSQFGVEQVTFDNTGAGSGLVDRTPTGFVPNDLYSWQATQIFDAGGGGSPLMIAAATPDLLQIDSDVAGPVYSGLVNGASVLTEVSDGAPITVSGGCVALQPFLFLYGSNGLIRNSNANDISSGTGWTGGSSNLANVAATKIVKGLPLRGGGQSPAGIFWALDALIRVSFIGGTQLWAYDIVSSEVSILGKNAPVEVDGLYMWPGVDRFFVYNGVVQELPNPTNLDWFYENLNFAQRNKVWGVRVPRFGEVWWFFPSGTSTECDKAVIYNVREKVWYDTRSPRQAGASARVFQRPVMAGGEDEVMSTRVTFTTSSGSLKPGDLVTGGTTGSTGVVSRVLNGVLNIENTSGPFVNGEVLTATSGTVTANANSVAQRLVPLWAHEEGFDKVYGDQVVAVLSYFETRIFSLTDGGMTTKAPQGADLNLTIPRLEPDFLLEGTMTVQMHTRAFAQAPEFEGPPQEITPTTQYVSLRDQGRLVTLKYISNAVGASYKMGKVLLKLQPGDERS